MRSMACSEYQKGTKYATLATYILNSYKTKAMHPGTSHQCKPLMYDMEE